MIYAVRVDLPFMKHWKRRKKKYPLEPILNVRSEKAVNIRLRSTKAFKWISHVENTGDLINSSGSK